MKKRGKKHKSKTVMFER